MNKHKVVKIIKILTGASLMAVLIIHALMLKSCAVSILAEANSEYEQRIELSEDTFTMHKDIDMDNVVDVCADSIMQRYESILKRLYNVECLVKNYHDDANVIISRANHFVELWLAISSAFIALFSILFMVNNFIQEKNIKDDCKEFLKKQKDEMKKWKKEFNSFQKSMNEHRKRMESYIQINKVSSIMSCLSSFPDPLLSSGVEKKKYALEYLSILYNEFERYVDPINFEDSDRNEEVVNNAQIIVAGVYVVVVKMQGLFTEVRHNIAFMIFSKRLGDMINDFISKKINKNNIVKELKALLDSFRQFNAGIS